MEIEQERYSLLESNEFLKDSRMIMQNVQL